MFIMHGLFDLRDGIGKQEFREAFDAFGAHLRSVGVAEAWRYMERAPHAGYDAGPPKTEFYVAVEFADRQQAECCWDYVERDELPIQSIHRAVNSKVTNASFFLMRDVEAEIP